MSSLARATVHRVWQALPKGGALPDEVWRRRHRGIVLLILLHAPALAAFGTATGHGFLHSTLESGVVALVAAVASWPRRSRSFRAAAATFGLVTASALLVHFSGGVIEMHFHFFVALGIISLYQDWTPFSLALVYVVVHHGSVGVLDSHAVYNHPAAQRNPWGWAAIHGGFVVAACIANLTAWRLNEQGFYDHLTGLANRNLFMDRVQMALARAARSQQPTAVLFLDLDEFKTVNDSLGHGTGDRLLVAVAERLTHAVRPSDTVCRLGGDEFAVLLEQLEDPDAAERVAARLLESLRTAFVADGREVTVRASIGIAKSELGAEQADELVRNADLAMYVAKDSGKGHSEVFEPAMHTALVNRLQVLADLRRAVQRREFVVHYQPLVKLASGQMSGVEALVRWQHPERGLVPPDQFISLAEQTGLIVDIGAWVLAQACVDARRLQEHFPSEPPLTVAVNLSAVQLQPGLVETVVAALAASGLDARTLVLEITESLIMDDGVDAVRYLEQLKSLGVRLAIDDFGTGYSSLSRLGAFPIDELKIDRSFITEIGVSSDGGPLVASTIAMAHSLGLRVVAEGVETVDQLQFLVGHSCEQAQGYLLGRPTEAAEIEVLLRTGGRPFRATNPDPSLRQSTVLTVPTPTA